MDNSPRSKQSGVSVLTNPPIARNGLEGKRVAMVTYSPYPDDPRPRRAIDALRGEGMTVDLICLAQGNSRKQETCGDLKVLRVPMKHRRGGKLSYAFQYGSFILISSLIFAWRSFARRYDLVYVHNMPDILVLSALVPKALGAKVILDLHDPMPELMTTIFNLDKESFSVRLIRSMEKWSIARTNLVVTVNLACKHIFSARSCKPEKIAVVMNAPDSQIFPFRAAQEQPVAQQDPDKSFVFMYHGSLVERNGLDLAVEALALAREKMPTAELRVYGPSTPFLERVMETVKAKGMQDIVHYFGPRRLEDLVREIDGCEVGVIPNQRNPFTDINTPTRIFEYLALGKPVIAPSTPGIQEYFNEESLVFFEPGNARDLAKQMQYAYAHRDHLIEIACKGQQIYLAHTWEQERQTLLCGVSKILNERVTDRQFQ
jgi:glycosyltransferase involved in cell wall biosynthesis